MALFGPAASHGRGRLAGRRGGALWVVWVAVVAFVLLQISITLMPMPVVAAPVAEDGVPCSSMMMDGFPMDMAMGNDQAPAKDDHGGTIACPLMKVGGCFAMCATVLPSPPAVPPAAATATTRRSAETQGAPLVVSPPQKPPRRT